MIVSNEKSIFNRFQNIRVSRLPFLYEDHLRKYLNLNLAKEPFKRLLNT
jgi:hypothetical protein